MTVPGIPTTVEGIWELANSAPVTTIDIGDGEFALGNLYPNQREEIARIGKRIIESTQGGPPLTKDEANPTNILSALLLAGDPRQLLSSRISSWLRCRWICRRSATAK